MNYILGARHTEILYFSMAQKCEMEKDERLRVHKVELFQLSSVLDNGGVFIENLNRGKLNMFVQHFIATLLCPRLDQLAAAGCETL